MSQKTVSSTILVIFGISGDLSHRYLLPALSAVRKAGQLPVDFQMLGISRRDITMSAVFGTPELLNSELEAHTELRKMNLDDPSDYKKLAKTLKDSGAEQIIFYFAVPPEGVQPIIAQMGKAGLNGPNIKLLLEKPFGVDLASAKNVIKDVAKYFNDQQVYRIDHYLAKEMAQNISVFLGGNTLFRDVWNSKFIESIEVIVAERINIEGRFRFYEQTGALRDVIQSHALQLAALTIMEPCTSVFEFEELPARRLAALSSMRLGPGGVQESAIRGQYEGYREEVENPKSNTETFVALTLFSGSPRWKNVPIRIVTGKNLDAKLSEIRIRFKKSHASQANLLVIRIQPDEGITLDLWVKEPGYERKLKKLKLGFTYEQHFDHLPDAYEQVLVDAFRANQHLFASGKEVLAAWTILQPVLDQWTKDGSRGLRFYKPGTSFANVLRSKSPKG